MVYLALGLMALLAWCVYLTIELFALQDALAEDAEALSTLQGDVDEMTPVAHLRGRQAMHQRLKKRGLHAGRTDR